MPTPPTLGSRLAQLRREKSAREHRDVLAQEIAEAVGVGKGSYSKYERDVETPREPTIARLEDYFQVPRGYLRYGTGSSLVRTAMSLEEAHAQAREQAAAEDLPAGVKPGKAGTPISSASAAAKKRAAAKKSS